MPIFEYVCLACGQAFEKLLKAAGVDTIDCPACGSTEVKKELSPFSSSGCSTSPSAGGGA